MKCKNCRHLGWCDSNGEMFFGWCPVVCDSPDQDMDRDCSHFEVRRNIDRIRVMDDHSLAQFLCDFRSCDSNGGHPCDGCKAESYCHTGHTGMEDWLQQPAEEEDT